MLVYVLLHTSHCHQVNDREIQLVVKMMVTGATQN